MSPATARARLPAISRLTRSRPLRTVRPMRYLTDRLTTEACRFIAANRDRPFFLYLPHYTVHTPIQAKPTLVEKYKKKIKSGMRPHQRQIRRNDRESGRGRRANHEHPRGPRGSPIARSSCSPPITAALCSRSYSTVNLYRSASARGRRTRRASRIPLIIKWPGVTPAGAALPRAGTGGVDFFPTYLELAALPGLCITSTARAFLPYSATPAPGSTVRRSSGTIRALPPRRSDSVLVRCALATGS